MEQSTADATVEARRQAVVQLLLYLQDHPAWGDLPPEDILYHLDQVQRAYRSASYLEEEKLIKAYLVHREDKGVPTMLELAARLGWPRRKAEDIYVKVRKEGRLI